jgi:PAS domain S-box-containing protein
LWPVSDQTASLIWLAAMCAVTLVRAIGDTRFRQAALEQQREQQMLWYYVCLSGAVVSGLVWGYAGGWLFPSEFPLHRFFLAFLLAGLCVGSIVMLSYIPLVFLGFSLPILLPLSLRFITAGDRMSLAMGVMLLMLTLILIKTSRMFNQTLQLSLNIRNDNAQLLEQLKTGNTRLETEINERRQAQQALQVSETRYRALYEQTPAMLHTIDATGKIINVSDFWLEELGYSREEVIGRPSLEFTTPNAGRQAQAAIGEFLRTGRCKDIPTQFVKRNGAIMDVLFSAIGERNAEGAMVRSLAVVVDITRRKQAEEALFQEKERALVTLASIGDAVITTDAGGLVEYLNPVAEALTGWKLEQAHEQALENVFRVIDEETRRPVKNPVERCLAEGKIFGLAAQDGVLLSRNGQQYAIQDCAAPIRNSSNEILGAVLIFRDVTAKETEKTLHRLPRPIARGRAG